LSAIPLDEHYIYASDKARLEAYRRAVLANVRPGMTVVDLGCGSGVLGALCLRAGAARVYAIDSTSMIEAARGVYAAAGFAEQVTFFRGMSTTVTLPEKADLAICDQAGPFGFDAGIVEYLEDARRRFVKPGGTVVPRRLLLEAAGVESERCYRNVSRWREADIAAELQTLGIFAENTKSFVSLERHEAVTGTAELGEIDLTADSPDYLSWPAKLVCKHDGILHGLAGWFRCELAEGVWMTNSPFDDKRIDRLQAFLPLADPVEVREGQEVPVVVMARPKEDFLAWAVESGGRRQRHSSLDAMPLGARDLRIGDGRSVPKLSSEGKARCVILGLCDGVRTVEEIIELVLRDHPDLLPSRKAIADFVQRVLSRDTELA